MTLSFRLTKIVGLALHIMRSMRYRASLGSTTRSTHSDSEAQFLVWGTKTIRSDVAFASVGRGRSGSGRRLPTL
jgi:hypothetical protein